MALRRMLTLALARQIRPAITRGQRLWVTRCPQSSINARPCRYLGSAGNGTFARPYSQSRSIMSSQTPSAAVQAEEKKTTQPDRVVEEPEVEEEEEQDPDSQPPVVEKWNEAVEAILQATRTAFASSPPYDAVSPGTFQSYWRGVFARLHEQVTSDASIPEHLTSPPCKKFVIDVFAQGAGDESYSCPCCLPWVEPSVKLESDAGVTKGDLVKGLGRFLYGEGLPRVHVEDEIEDEVEGNDVVPDDDDDEEEREKRTGVLVHGADWMTAGRSDDNKERHVYTGHWIGRAAMIWMYCCQPGEFEEKAAARLRNGARGEDESGATKAKL